jgi:hypothetical protein
MRGGFGCQGTVVEIKKAWLCTWSHRLIRAASGKETRVHFKTTIVLPTKSVWKRTGDGIA